MDTLYRYITLYWILCYLLPASEGSFSTVHGTVGENVTLTCTYDQEYYGHSHTCWGRAEVPSSKCDNKIISTDGNQVNFRASERYHLQSGVADGDVSLTIINATESDSGIYGCRVEIRGPFNDKKQNFHLKISKTSKANRRLNQSAITLTTTKSPTPGKSSTLSAWSVESSPQTGQTESVVSSTGHPRQLMTENGTGDQSSSPDPVVILTSLLLVVIVVTVFLVMMRKNQQNNLMKEKAQRGGVSSVFSPNSNPQPLPRETAVDNIYQLEENNTYETCP